MHYCPCFTQDRDTSLFVLLVDPEYSGNLTQFASKPYRLEKIQLRALCFVSFNDFQASYSEERLNVHCAHFDKLILFNRRIMDSDLELCADIDRGLVNLV